MKRRELIKTLSAGALLAQLPVLSQSKIYVGDNLETAAVLKARALKPGDSIGIISPATAVTSPDDYALVKELADYLGLKYKFAKNVKKGSGYKTRSVNERIDDLHEMFSDEEVNAVICIRGGYGSGQILDKIDYTLIKKHPKIFIGYSDITAMHLAINKVTGLVTFHGPMLLASFPQLTIDNFKKTIFSSEPIGILKNPDAKTPVRSANPVRTIKSGKSTGRLTGGNLSIICSLMGTKYEIDTKDKILFIEDVDEEPYRIDRMLTQLKTAGKLDQAAGIVFGNCTDCSSSSKLKPSLSWDYSLAEVLDNILGDIAKPSFFGLTFGHSPNQFTLPYGVTAEMDADSCSINIIESHLSGH